MRAGPLASSPSEMREGGQGQMEEHTYFVNICPPKVGEVRPASRSPHPADTRAALLSPVERPLDFLLMTSPPEVPVGARGGPLPPAVPSPPDEFSALPFFFL